MQQIKNIEAAEICLPTKDLNADLEFFQNILGFRLEEIYPAERPEIAILSGYGLRLRFELGSTLPPGKISILISDSTSFNESREAFTAPNGTIIDFRSEKALSLQTLVSRPVKLEISRLGNNDAWTSGRAGMLYRDLIKSRLDGRIVASHIWIPNGGPVPDVVHYHHVAFQMIFCCQGWVRLVYEDQGPPFLVKAGDCVLQPPRIRHRVLEASDNLEVVEVAFPAYHATTIEHDMELPTHKTMPGRKFSGTVFRHYQQDKTGSKESDLAGFVYFDTGIEKATGGFAGVRVLETNSQAVMSFTHTGEILFYFVLEGSAELRIGSKNQNHLVAKDAFVVPAHTAIKVIPETKRFQVLEVSIPPKFITSIVSENTKDAVD